MAEKSKSRSDRFSPGLIYLALICCLIIVILIVNGYFEINRTRTSLTDILENQGETLVRGLEREIQNTVAVIGVMDGVPGGLLLNMTASTNFFALEDAVVDYLLGIATRIDQKDTAQSLSEPDLDSIAQRERVKRIEILNELPPSEASEGAPSPYELLLRGSRDMVIIPFKKLIPDREDTFSVAIRKALEDGIIVVTIDASQMGNLKRRFAIQNVLESIGFGEVIEYVSVYDNALSLIAQIGSNPEGTARDISFLKTVQGDGGPKSRFRLSSEKQEVFETTKTLLLEQKPYGIIQAGLSTEQIQTILSRSRTNVILSVAVLLGLSMTGVALIYINQLRHLARLREMEERAQAAERLLSVGKLGAGLAHEIRNPLNAIAMAIQRLHREFPPREEKRREQYDRFIGVIREEINRLNQMVDRFVLFSKPDKLALVPASIPEMLDNISVLFAEEAKARSVVIQTEINPKLPLISMDKGKMAQALVNVVTNGLHAMKEGGRLTIEAEMDRRGWVGILVTDTGKGIPKEEIERIFDYSYTTREKGLGLGLPLAHKIIEEHGGRITIESRVGKGTTVSILLPIAGPQ